MSASFQTRRGSTPLSVAGAAAGRPRDIRATPISTTAPTPSASRAFQLVRLGTAFDVGRSDIGGSMALTAIPAFQSRSFVRVHRRNPFPDVRSLSVAQTRTTAFAPTRLNKLLKKPGPPKGGPGTVSIETRPILESDSDHVSLEPPPAERRLRRRPSHCSSRTSSAAVESRRNEPLVPSPVFL